MSFRDAPLGAGPESMTGLQSQIWIPGSREDARPGMTAENLRVVGMEQLHPDRASCNIS
jgi:hypothetical protein